ncbi:Subtilase [Trema orientale]|uniref:Subtilase n=1 Tax=Trema orientale TaxID=63057 RepID=A0A2P5CSL9_TREOI|nr:Subtilase [Trema orientale]
MAKASQAFLLYSLLVATFVLNCHGDDRKVHVVYMGDRPQGDFSAASTHHSMLKSVLGSPSRAKDSLIYSYGKSINGFAAKLSDEEVARFSDMEGVISVIPNRKFQLHTTRSWDFVGLSKSKLSGSQEGDVIIGLLDTGVWPESESFKDDNIGSPPAKWKGTCQGEGNFTCNNKIIGARYYNSDGYYSPTDFKSPRDSIGHGSHTASTAAGREVSGASFYGLANGTARGGVPNARIAVYKVCWGGGFCSLADILAGFDDAIADGVDIISISIGGGGPIPYFEDPIAIGSFHAMKRGILTSSSAGNAGPDPLLISNYAPWLLTVAASTIDRKFVARAVLGNGQVFDGVTINSFSLNRTTYPLIWGGDAANYSAGFSKDISRYCFPGTLNSHQVAGKIVFCEAVWDGSGILLADGVGTIMADFVNTDVAFNFPLPSTLLTVDDGQKVLDYIKTTENPFATIEYSDTWDDAMAPSVVSFSSRGPNPITADILKPDLTAPGVDILAAWSPVSPPSVYDEDPRSVSYNIISGTSMSCPHASGVAAYVKAAHPDWSPAAIKSALMTTATILDSRKHEDLEFAYGSGQINPQQALDPGLIYDTSESDYIDFLCEQGYNTTTLRLITGDNSSACASTTPGRAWDLNYPSFAVAVQDGETINAEFTRTVTNVGPPNSTYSVIAYVHANVAVTVQPPVLSFSAVGEKKSYKVTVSGPAITQQPIASGAVVWKDAGGSHVVRSPIVVYNYIPGIASIEYGGGKPDRKPGFIGKRFFHA